jgi:hypothetical protein
MLGGLAAACAIVAAAAPARAQLAPTYSGSEGVSYMGQEETFSAIRQLGTCLVQRRQQDASALLATAPGSQQEASAVRVLIGRHTACAPRNSRMGLPRDVIRGSIAEAMYRRLGLAAPSADPTAPRDGAKPESLVEFARCVVRASPQEVHDLLTSTRLGTRAEHQAMLSMAPQLRGCLPSSDNLQLAAPLVRLSLADALYDRARRAPPAQQRVP